MRADLIHRQRAGFEQLDRGGPRVGAEMRAPHIELLVIGDDRPVHRHRVFEDRVLDEDAVLSQQVEPLRHGRRVARRLDVDVGAEAAGGSL